MPLPRLHLIGPGRLGRTLARLWREAGCVDVDGVVGRHGSNTAAAIAFIGGGTTRSLDALPPADLLLLAVPDDALPELVAQLAGHHALKPGGTAFHCSGALSSAVLAPLAARGAAIASIHPLKSFADPAQAILDFSGTHCGHEGDPAALAVVRPLFEAIGGHCLPIRAEHKTLYHAGAVLACNDLTALMEAALRCLERAGLPRSEAWPALRPLIDGTLANIDRLGTAAALTGPVARGDGTTVARQLAATTALAPELGDAYRSLGKLALTLARPTLAETQIAVVAQALDRSAPLPCRMDSPGEKR